MKTYKHGSSRLYVGDCLDKGVVDRVSSRLESLREAGHPVTLMFVDPPFNIGVDYGRGVKHDRRPWAVYVKWIRRLVSTYGGMLDPGAMLCLHLPSRNAAHALVAIERRHPDWKLCNWVVLHQQFGQCRNQRDHFINSHVSCLMFRLPGGRGVWKGSEAREPSVRLTMGDKRVAASPYAGMRPFLDVWHGPNLGRVQGNNRERLAHHKNQLPEKYLARIVRIFSRKGDVVVDPNAGSGTTARVAHALGRIGVTVEKDKKNAASAAESIKRGPVFDVKGLLY